MCVCVVGRGDEKMERKKTKSRGRMDGTLRGPTRLCPELVSPGATHHDGGIHLCMSEEAVQGPLFQQLHHDHWKRHARVHDNARERLDLERGEEVV
jgi:hypothetical protein